MRKFNGRAAGKGGPGRGEHHFLEEIFFPRKIGNRKILTGEKHMRLEFIY